MSNTERFLLKAIGDDHAATKAGVLKFIELCGKYGNGVIYVPTMQNLESTILASAIGQDVMKSLAKHKSVKLSSGQNIELCSDKTFKNYKNSSVYLVLWATPSMIDSLEEAYSCKASVVVTWLENDADKWEENYRPTLLKW